MFSPVVGFGEAVLISVLGVIVEDGSGARGVPFALLRVRVDIVSRVGDAGREWKGAELSIGR